MTNLGNFEKLVQNIQNVRSVNQVGLNYLISSQNVNKVLEYEVGNLRIMEYTKSHCICWQLFSESNIFYSSFVF